MHRQATLTVRTIVEDDSEAEPEDRVVQTEEERQDEPEHEGGEDEERQADDDEEPLRSFRATFSSTAPVFREFWVDGEWLRGMEVLDHSPESVDMAFMASGRAPVLFQHAAWGRQIGVVDSAELEGDTGVAEGRFSRTERAAEIVQDVVDGIIKNVSVGYEVRALRVEPSENPDELPILRAIDWAPFEMSLVSVPADMENSAIEARSQERVFQTRVYNMAVKSKTNTETSNPANGSGPSGGTVVVTRPELTDEARELAENAAADEQQRQKDIRELAARHQRADLGEKAIVSGMPLDLFKGTLLDVLAEGTPLYERADKIGMTERESKAFSFTRLLNALANPKSRNAAELAGLELEACQAVADQSGKNPKSATSVLIPFEAQEQRMNSGAVSKILMRGGVPGIGMKPGVQAAAQKMQRTLETGVLSAGGHLVGVDHLGSSFIEFLYNNMVVREMGAMVLSGLQGNVKIPKRSASGTHRWTGEQTSSVTGADLDIGDSTFDTVNLNLKEVTSTSLMSRRLLQQSDPSVDMLVRMDLATIIALAVDAAAIAGNAADANEPNGILETAGVTDIDLTSFSYESVVEIVTAVLRNNALRLGNLGWLINANGWKRGMITSKDTGSGRFIIEEGANTMVGYRFALTEQVPSDLGAGSDLNAVIFGAFQGLLIGEWGTLELQVDPFTAVAAGAVRINVFFSTDVALRYPEVFAKSETLSGNP